MDSIVSNLVNLGIGGCMAAAVLILLWHLIKVTIPELIKENRAALKDQQDTFKESLKDLTTALTMIRDTVNKLADRVEATDRHVKRNEAFQRQMLAEFERIKNRRA